MFDDDDWQFDPPPHPAGCPAFGERFHAVYSVMNPHAWRYEASNRYRALRTDPRALVAAASDIAHHLLCGPPDVVALSPTEVVDQVRTPTTRSLNWLIAARHRNEMRDGSASNATSATNRRPGRSSRPRGGDPLESHPELAMRFRHAWLRLTSERASEVTPADLALLDELQAIGSPSAIRLEQAIRRARWMPGLVAQFRPDRDPPW